MTTKPISRRNALKSSLAWAGASVLIGREARAVGYQNANDRPRMAAIGCGSRWSQRATGIESPYGSAQEMRKFGDYVAVCDADADRVEGATALAKNWSGMAVDGTFDYRAVIDRSDVDIVHISTPDHWHAKIAIEAMLAGKDVYCEKPMTLTIEEGQQMCDACRRTGRIVQIGTQQRSNALFVRAIAMVREGRIGQLKRVTCSVGGAPTSPPIAVVQPPKNLDWNLWQGPVADVPYRFLAGPNGETKSWSRCHYEFRWWYEYSGGKLTDWGAHHVDIATWAMGKTDTGPISIDPVMAKHPMDFKDGYPTKDDQYNTATEFRINAAFADGMELTIQHGGSNGVLLEGTEGRIFVNRGRLTGTPVEELVDNPLPDGALESAYKDRPLTDHFRNFFESVTENKEPISDVFSHHRALSTCHLASIAIRLGRKIEWNPTAEQVIGDQQAQSFLSRDRRKGFEIEV
jgi:predicted dehydrogenase